MLIHFTRDSVCMGDDMMDNSRNYELPDDAVWTDIWSLVREKSFLPHDTEINVVWLLMNNKGEEIFSYFAAREIMCKITIKNSLRQICGDSNILHFRYYTSPTERGEQLFRSYKGDKYSMWRDGVMGEYQRCETTKGLEQKWMETI